MAIVHKLTEKTQSEFHNQEFFQSFNWFNFTAGDIVWLEDYDGEVEKIAGIFTGYKNTNEPVIRLIPNKQGAILAQNNINSIFD